ncbi:MAG: OmpA family protein [Paludibacter sp.]|nr:OmpA family protein [Paludibacter sp.]
MENLPVRNSLNPAFQPLSNFYLGFPVLGYSQFNLGNNSITLQDVVYNDANGNPITFLHPNGNKRNFYNALKPTTGINADFQVNLLEFGFRTGKSYWNFSLKEKIDGQIGIPSDILKLLFFGTPELENNFFDFRPLGLQATAYTEAGLGFSRVLNDKLTVGAKLKLLYGNANVSAVNENFTLNAGIEEWALKGNGSINYSSPIDLNGNSFQTFDLALPTSILDYVKPSGLGAGFDLGFTYKPIKNLTLSAALTDFGMIRWNKNLKKIGFEVDYKFTGLDSLNINSNTNFNTIADSLFSSIQSSFKDSVETLSTAYNTNTSPKINVGVEYSLLNNKLSLGLLSRTLFQNKTPFQEFTASINGRPVNWFNMSLSYSILNGRMSNIGAGIGLRTGFIHWFVSADYIPLYYIPLQLNQINSDFPIFNALIPSKTSGFNVAFGVNLVLGNRKDTDKDGVVDRKDKCPDTPLEVKVDKKGCPIDSDGDGVPDNLDKCASTPKAAYAKIDKNGCPLDDDRDGVPDYLDKCPNTPLIARGFVDINGCELDSDKDGVFDYLDKCPDTMVGMKVDSIGCQIDTDGDGVLDHLDLCPETPLLARRMIDKNGCPIDTDGDGIPDYLDKCPTVKGIASNNGCEEVKAKIKPLIKPVEVKPVINQELKSLFQKALQGIQFESGNSLILPRSNKILNQIAGVLIANPTYLIEVRGFTDNVGNSKTNLILSSKRAIAVKKYLVRKGVEESRINTNGYGDTLPVATNKTAIGRSINRRVEFIVSYVEITFD